MELTLAMISNPSLLHKVSNVLKFAAIVKGNKQVK